MLKKVLCFPTLVLAVATLLVSAANPAYAFHFPWDQGHDTFQPEDPEEPDNPPEEPDRDCEGDPVDLKSGNFSYSDEDVLVTGRGPRLALRRIYHSQDRRNGRFGHGWHTSFATRVVVTFDGKQVVAIVRRADGRRERFISVGDGTFLSPPGNSQRLLAHPDGTLTLTHRNGTVLGFDIYGRLANVMDRNSNALTLSYDAASFLTSVTDAAGRMLSFTKGPNGKVAAATDPMGRSHIYGYDSEGNLVTVTDPVGSVTSYVYDSSHNLIRVVDARGTTVVQNLFDGKGRVIRQDMPFGSFLFDYFASDRTRVTDRRGNVSVHQFSECGGPILTTDPLGRTTSWTYDDNLNVTSTTDGNGHTSQFTYDSFDNVLQQTDPLGSSTSFTYEPNTNRVTSITDPRGGVVTFAYDGKGNLLTMTDPLGNVSRLTYDSFGQMTLATNTLGNRVSFAYDTFGNRIRKTGPRGGEWIMEYDLVGNLIRSVDPNGLAREFQYDPADRLIRRTDPAGTSTYEYDANGNRTKVTDAKGQVTQYFYDAENQLTSYVDALGNTKQFTYDPNGNVVSIHNRNGQDIRLEYDAADQLVRKILPGGEVTAFVYDPNGNFVSVTDPDSVVTYTYDANDRQVSSSTNGSPSQPDTTIAYTYDASGNRLTMEDPEGGVTSYAYDPRNLVTSITNPKGKRTDFTYDSGGRRSRMTYANGVSTAYGFDTADQLLTLSHVDTMTYAYDAAGNRTSRSDADGTHTFSYDGAARLTAAVHPAADDESFSYDGAGNRTASHNSATAVFDAANRLLEDDNTFYAYDGEGNLIERRDKASGSVSTFTYDAENQMVSAVVDGKVSTYRYDGLGRRIEKDVDGVVTRYVYDQDDILMEYEGNGGLRARYTHGPETDEPLILDNADGSFYYHADGVGSITYLSDDAGDVVNSYVYDSFGKVTFEDSSTVANPYSYAGRERDSETGLYFNRARYYDPAVGRFTGEDRIGRIAGQNLYSYVRNNPLLLTDPFGLQPKDKYYGLPKDFWDWYHRNVKGKGDPDLTKPEAEELHEEWENEGRPKGDDKGKHRGREKGKKRENDQEFEFTNFCGDHPAICALGAATAITLICLDPIPGDEVAIPALVPLLAL